jgi:hypothetical protein
MHGAFHAVQAPSDAPVAVAARGQQQPSIFERTRERGSLKAANCQQWLFLEELLACGAVWIWLAVCVVCADGGDLQQTVFVGQDDLEVAAADDVGEAAKKGAAAAAVETGVFLPGPCAFWPCQGLIAGAPGAAAFARGQLRRAQWTFWVRFGWALIV